MKTPGARSLIYLRIAWGLLILSSAGLITLGFFQGEPLGSLAFGILAVSALLNLLVLLAILFFDTPHVSFRVTWCVLGAGAFIVGAYPFEAVHPDLKVLAWYCAAVLSFPLGLAIMFLYGAFAQWVWTHYSSELPDAVHIAALGAILVTGYLQWYWLLPRVLPWLKKRVAARK